MGAGMDQHIMDDQIVALRQRREGRDIGRKSASEIEDPFNPINRSRSRFERLTCSFSWFVCLAAQEMNEFHGEREYDRRTVFPGNNVQRAQVAQLH